MVSQRTLGWPLAEMLSSGARSNLLALEALAAAEHLHARIRVAGADHNPPLLDAAVKRGVRIRVI